MTRTLERLNGRRRIDWRTLTGLLLVPLTIAGALIWGLWNPTDRLDTVTAAVVNLDEPVEVDGQTVPMGRVLAAELIGGGSTDGSADSGSASSDGTDPQQNYTWLLTDESDAAAGLDDGRYTAVITIPKGFSRAATSVSRGADEAERATIDVQTSERGRLLDAALANIVTTTATSVLNERLGTQYVGQVFVGMKELGAGVAKAADGASKLADGGSKLADGADGLTDGAAQLADGTAQLSDGVGQLASGASQLADGTKKLAGGSKKLAAGAKRAAEGGTELATGVKTYTRGAAAAIDGLQQGGLAAVGPLTQYRDAIAADLIPMPDAAAKQQAIDGLNQLIGSLTSAGTDDPKHNPLTKLKLGGPELAQGAAKSARGQRQLAAGLAESSKGTLKLSTGASGLADGVGALAAKTPELATGASQLADGTSKIATGVRGTADGAKQLAGGLEQASVQVPDTTEAQRTKLAETMVRPVETVGASDQLFNAAGVPLFAGIALWGGAFAAFLVLAPLWRRTREAARGVGFVTLRSAVPALAVGAAQGVLVGLILPPLLGYDWGQGFAFFGLSVLAGVAFALVNQGLSALLGGIGRFLAFALLVVAFAIGVVSTAPPLLQTIGDASPVGALFAGFQPIAMGTSGVGGAVALLVLWGLGGLLLTAFAVMRTRARSLSDHSPGFSTGPAATDRAEA